MKNEDQSETNGEHRNPWDDEEPKEGMFAIHSLLGLTAMDALEVEAHLTKLVLLDQLSVPEVIELMTKDSNGWDVFIGFKLALFVFLNEDRLLPAGVSIWD